LRNDPSSSTWFGDHRANVIVEKLVDHDPVEAGQFAKGGGGKREQAFQVGRLVELLAGFIKRRKHLAASHCVGSHTLKLDDQILANGAHRRIEALGYAIDRFKHCDCGAVGRQFGQLRGELLPQYALERFAQPIVRQTAFDIARGPNDIKRRAVCHQQDTMRLDRPRQMDGLALATG